jgi:DNA-binding transcriptional ArsR family regulator
MAGSNPKGHDLFTALGHPMRRRILREMLDTAEELSPRELAIKLSEQLSALSYHVRVLAECKTIELIRTQQIRGSTQHFYRAVVKANWVLSALEAPDDPPSGKGARGKRRADGST